jgi:putative transposase
MIEPGHNSISIRRQCELIGLSRASLYYEPAEESAENLLLMRLLDEQYMRTPFYGVLKMTAWLCENGHSVERLLHRIAKKPAHVIQWERSRFRG